MTDSECIMSLFKNGFYVKLVRARKNYKCYACGEILKKGHKYAYQQCIEGKEIITTKFCEQCYVSVASLCIDLKLDSEADLPPPDIIAEYKLKSGDIVRLLEDDYGWYDGGLIKLKSQQEWEILDINRKSTNGMYAQISTKDGKSTAYQLSHLIKVFKD